MANPSEAWLLCRNEHHRAPWASDPPAPQNHIPMPAPQSQPAGQTPLASDTIAGLQRRLDNANAYFRRKAAEVLTDDTAVRLLAVLYQHGLIELEHLNSCGHGIPLAKISAAGFCEIGATAIYITLSGERFIGSLIPLAPAADAKPVPVQADFRHATKIVDNAL